ncbi:MAG: hypothetical protein KBA13_03185 [Chitinophagales bacterium]|nr:hypothetical protein [Chitinophagales bacterium]
MDTNLNIFKTYENVKANYKIENNLTRALAITLKEDTFFFHEFIKFIFNNTIYYHRLFGTTDNYNINVSIDIQIDIKAIQDYEHLFAISISESELSNIWDCFDFKKDESICDLVIKLDSVFLFIEIKKDGEDCTNRLYNQIFNLVKQNTNIEKLDKSIHQKLITPIDLKWSELMQIALSVYKLQNSFNTKNRFLTDFIDLVRNYNFRWLPEIPINALKPNDTAAIIRRIETAINVFCEIKNCNKINYIDRLGILFDKDWAQEILFKITDNGDLNITINPGNSIKQGYALFNKNPSFNYIIILDKTKYEVEKKYHIKFTSFQKYFSGLRFVNYELISDRLLYSKENFYKYSGRKKRDEWKEFEQLLNDTLLINWKEKCNWDELMIHSAKDQFDILFTYELNIYIPFKTLKELDKHQTSTMLLMDLIFDVYEQFSNNLLIEN